jgi:hypothetical protein
LLRRGGKHDKILVVDDENGDYERAEKEIVKSIARVEELVEKVVAKEVDTLFHQEHTNRDQVRSKAGRLQFHFENDPNLMSDHHERVHSDHRILRAVEAAEQAVIHAIEREVDTLFHEKEHHTKDDNFHHTTANAKGKTTVQDGIQKASTVQWLQHAASSLIEDYYVPHFFLE